MTTAIEQIQRMSERHTAKKGEALKVAVLLLSGVEIGDSQIVEACDLCRMTTADFAQVVKTLTERKAAWDEYHSVDWDGVITAASSDADKKTKVFRAAEVEAAAAIERRDRAYTAMHAAINTPMLIDERRLRKSRELHSALCESGTTDDWRKVTGFDDIDMAEIDASVKEASSVKASKPSKPAKQTTAA